MKASLIILALTLSASPALAETASQTPPLTPEIPAHGVRTFTPTEFEQNLFKDRSAISQTSGEDVYRALCQGCHMADRQGASGAGSYPALAGNQMVASGDYVVTVITHGQKAMPPFGSMLTDQQIVAVVNYLQKDLPSADVVPATVQTVEAARASAGPAPD